MKIREHRSTNRNQIKMKKHYLIYCRKSSESEDKQLESVNDQVDVLTELASNKNLPVLKIFKESMSAKAPGRPIFNELVELIRTREDIKGIICWHLNRLSRNPVDSGAVQWLLQKGQIEEVVTPSRVYSELDSDLIMSLEGGLANRFIRDLRRDTKRGLESKLKKGQAPILAPVGYKNNTHKRQGERDIVPHSLYFTLMRKVFDHALTGNFSVMELCKKANNLGIKTARGDKISKTQMHRVLTNPFYTGKFQYAGQLYEGIHKPILTDEEFDLLQDILTGNSKPRKITHNFPLTGLIRCGDCGMMITAESHTKKYKNGTKQTFTYYRCSKKANKECLQPFLRAKELERQVLEYLEGIKISPRYAQWAIKWLNKANDQQKEVVEAKYTALKADYEDTIKRLQNLLQLKISPENKDGVLLSDKEFAELRSGLVGKRDKLQTQLKGIDKHADDWTAMAVKTFNYAASAHKRFAGGDVETKKTILRAFGSNLYLKDKQLTIKPRKPFLLIQEAMKKLDDSVRLEPVEGIANLSQIGIKDSPSYIVGLLANDVRTYYAAEATRNANLAGKYHFL